MSKHTPGKWEWTEGYGGLISRAGGEYIPVIDWARYEGMWLAYKKEESERKANADLIASAPDLLEALEGIVNNLDTGDGVRGWYHIESEHIMKALDAIKRAKGEA